MQSGKSLVKTKLNKFNKEKFEREVEAGREHQNKRKHNDKALLRSKREEEREDYDGFHIDEGY